MGNPNPVKKFQKGNKFGGRKPLPADVLAARNLSYEDAVRTIVRVRNMTQAEAETVDGKSQTLGERAVFRAYLDLDYKAIQTYEDRLWGKAKEQIELTGDNRNPLAFKIEVVAAKAKNDADTGNTETTPDIPE